MPGKSWRIPIVSAEENCDRFSSFSLYSPDYAKEQEQSSSKYNSKLVHGFFVAPSSVFDELVIDNWFHLEQMDDNYWWLQVGDARVDICLDDSGKPTVRIERGRYGPYIPENPS